MLMRTRANTSAHVLRLTCLLMWAMLCLRANSFLQSFVGVVFGLADIFFQDVQSVFLFAWISGGGGGADLRPKNRLANDGDS